MSELKDKTVHAVVWNLIDKFGAQAIYLALGIVLGRILSPNDYGLMAIISIFISYSNLLMDGGFGGALIRKKAPTNLEYSSVFFVNNIVSLVIYLLVFITAPFISEFYKAPGLDLLIRVCLLSVIFNAFGFIHYIRLTKSINFKKASIANLSSLVIAGGVAILLAKQGYGVWSLVVQNVLYASIRTLLFMIISHWRPMIRCSWTVIREMLDFSLTSMLAQIINLSFQLSYTSFIGKRFTKGELGYYSQGSKWSDIITSSIAGTMQTATYPIFAEIQDDAERLKRAYRKSMRFTAFVSLPSLLCLMLVAEPLLIMLIGEKWIPAIPYLQIMAIVGIFSNLANLNRNYIRIHGDARLLLRIDIAKLILAFISIYIAFPYGLFAMALAYLTTQVVVYVITVWFIGRKVNYTLWEQLYDVAPYFVLAITACAAAFPFSWLIESPILLMISQGVVLAGIYLFLSKVFGSVIYYDIKESISKRMIPMLHKPGKKNS